MLRKTFLPISRPSRRVNIVDFMDPFENKYYYVKEMKGSYSLKAVVPALLPELSYDKLPISNGDQASVEYLKLPLIEDTALAEKTKQDIKKYCEFDTFVMVKLVERLREL